MFIKTLSCLVLIFSFMEVILENIRQDMSEMTCRGETKAFSARLVYNNESGSESTFNGCITGNDITKIELLSQVSTIEANTFVNMPKLHSLDISNVNSYILEPGFLKNTPNLKNINAVSNRLFFIAKDVFNHLELSNLYLNSNNIWNIHTGAFANLSVNVLYLTSNKLSIINGSWFINASIRELEISHNDITILRAGTFKEVKNLETLRLEGNKIYFIEDNTFSGLTNLKYLYLFSNALTNINFLNDTNIYFVNLGHNLISSMDMNESMKIKEIVIYPNPWTCKCLMKFWRYAWKHGVKYLSLGDYLRIYEPETMKQRLVCIVHGGNCDSNYVHPEVMGKYFKLVNSRYYDIINN